MNLVLFQPQEIGVPLSRNDRRAEHVLKVLRRQVGDIFDAGVINGPRGKATLTSITPDALEFTFAPLPGATPRSPIVLVVGLPRPQTARDILRDATTVGVRAIHFVRTEKSEPSYADSTLWSTGEWRRHVVTGAEQAFDTTVPEVTFREPLRERLARVATDSEFSGSARLALDNYESATALATLVLASDAPVVLAIGSERGWSTTERELLRQSGFQLVHLGPRVLRTETAVVAALTLVRARLGLM